MHDLLADYWWLSIFSVPALAIAIQRIANRVGWVDALSAPLRRKLSTFDDSFPGHWVVTATLDDGRRFSRVVIDRRYRLVSEAPLPFGLRDLRDVAWEGAFAHPVGPVLQLSEGRRGTAG